MILDEPAPRIGSAIELPDEFVHVSAWIAIGLIRAHKPRNVILRPEARRFERIGRCVPFAHPTGSLARSLDAFAHDIKIERIGSFVIGYSYGILLSGELHLHCGAVRKYASVLSVVEQEPVFKGRDGQRDVNTVVPSQSDCLLEPWEPVMMLTLSVTHDPDLIVGDGLLLICECLALFTPIDCDFNEVQWVAIRCFDDDIFGGEPKFSAEVVQIAAFRLRTFEQDEKTVAS